MQRDVCVYLYIGSNPSPSPPPWTSTCEIWQYLIFDLKIFLVSLISKTFNIFGFPILWLWPHMMWRFTGMGSVVTSCIKVCMHVPLACSTFSAFKLWLDRKCPTSLHQWKCEGYASNASGTPNHIYIFPGYCISE